MDGQALAYQQGADHIDNQRTQSVHLK